MRVTAPSACPWLAHPVSGLFLVTSRPVQTRFRCACTLRLKLATKINSLTHYTKGTPSRHLATEVARTAPTVCRHPVSGSLSLPALGCFSPFPHGTGSLSVTEEYLGLEGGPPMFRQGFPCPALLEDPDLPLPVRGCHPLWRAFPDTSGSLVCATGLVRVRSSLLAESLLMSFPPANEIFQFAGFASCRYGFTPGYPFHVATKAVGCPIRRSQGHRALAPRLSFSQRATSFIASRCQGIHQMPFSCSATPSPKAAPAAVAGGRCQMPDVRCQTAFEPTRPAYRCIDHPAPDR